MQKLFEFVSAFLRLLFRKAAEASVDVVHVDQGQQKAEPKEVKEVKKEIPIVTGWVSAKYESGGRGVKTISKGTGDFGGVSYGVHQLSSKTGTMADFLKSKHGQPFAPAFAGLQPGSDYFNAVYATIADTRGEAFAQAQADYIASTHYEPMARKLDALGFNLSQRHQAVREMVYSTAVQYGPNSSVVAKSGAVASDSDLQIITKVQDYKTANVDTHFRSSSQKVRDSVKQRTKNEKQTLIDFLNS